MDGVNLMNVFLTAGLGEMAKIAVNELVKALKVDYEESLYDKTSEVLQEFLTSSYKNNAIMHTIVFRGIEKSIFDLYIPLTLKYTVDEVEDEIIVNEDCLSHILMKNKSIIIDNAGMGKSTIVKYLATQIVLNKKGIPIIIELRKLNKGKEILDFIVEQFDLFDKKIELDDLKKLLKAGGFIIFFDGYDEVAEELRQSVTDDIRHFMDVASNNTYILTSREESELSSFSEFHGYSIKPLELEEAFELIKKYDENGEKSKRLIETIEKEANLNVLREFLTNPLLVSLLYKTYVYKEEIPYKKIEFYKQVYEALFNDHDKSKGAYVHPKKSKLDINDFESVLTYLGFLGIKKWRVEYEKEELINDITLSIDNLAGNSPAQHDYFEDIIHAVPLFQKDGNMYRWIHKSFMEYYAAKYICYETGSAKEKILANLGIKEDNIKFMNVLDFCYELDLKTFRKCILFPWLRELIKTHKEVSGFIEEKAPKYKNDERINLVLTYILFYGKAYILPATEHQMNIMNQHNPSRFSEAFAEIEEQLEIVSQESNGNAEKYYSFSGYFIVKKKKIGEAVERLVTMKKIPLIKRISWKEASDEEVIHLEKGVIISVEQLLEHMDKENISAERVLEFLNMLGMQRGPIIDIKSCERLLSEIEKEIKVINTLKKSVFDISL